MSDEPVAAPDGTAVRVALWRALHLALDAPPHVLEDEIGLALAAPEDGWQRRPDMDAQGTRFFRASIVARARFIEDLVIDEAAHGVGQYVILGAGLDSFAQRRPEIASRLRLFEIDRPGPQAWKRQRLAALGFGVPAWLKLVPVDFEARQSWRRRLAAAGFDAGRPAVVAATGVSMYLTRDAVAAMLREIAALAPGSTLAMTYLLPIALAEPAERSAREWAERGARARHALHQLLRPVRDAGACPRGGLQGGADRRSRRPRRALFRRPGGRAASVALGRAAGRDDVALRTSPRQAADARSPFSVTMWYHTVASSMVARARAVHVAKASP